MKNKLRIYCDGSCFYKSKLGGIGVYITDGEREWFISKGFEDTTISRMEGFALLLSIRALNPKVEQTVEVYSDSEYVIKTFTEARWVKWQMINWNQIKNREMWQSILKEMRSRPNLTLKFNHIRGHQEDLTNPHVFGNRVADLLASFKVHKVYHSDKEL